MEKLDIAKAYLKLGWNIIPINKSTKRPLIKWEQFQKERVTEELLNEWYKKYPNANLAVITGKVSNLIVIDIDSIEGREAYIAQFGEIHDTIAQTTGKSGGLHLFFKHPGDIDYGNRAQLIKDVDVRADGGYVIISPSIHPTGVPYTWVIDPIDMELGDLMDLPEELKRLLATKGKDPAGIAENGNIEGWVQEALLGVEEGQRNHICAKLAGFYLRVFEGNAIQAETILQDWNLRNSPPLEWKEIRDVVQSVAKREGRNVLGDSVGETIEKIQVMRYPDGTRRYKVFLKNHSDCAEMASNELIFYSHFKIKFFELTHRLPTQMKQLRWEQMVNKAMNEAEIIDVSVDETPLGLIINLINSEVLSVGCMSDLNYISQRIILKDGMIYLKMETLLNMFSVKREKVTRKELGRYLRLLGFESDLLRNNSHVIRCWKRNLDVSWENLYQ